MAKDKGKGQDKNDAKDGIWIDNFLYDTDRGWDYSSSDGTSPSWPYELGPGYVHYGTDSNDKFKNHEGVRDFYILDYGDFNFGNFSKTSGTDTLDEFEIGLDTVLIKGGEQNYWYGDPINDPYNIELHWAYVSIMYSNMPDDGEPFSFVMNGHDENRTDWTWTDTGTLGTINVKSMSWDYYP
jgi:hypothetical protein